MNIIYAGLLFCPGLCKYWRICLSNTIHSNDILLIGKCTLRNSPDLPNDLICNESLICTVSGMSLHNKLHFCSGNNLQQINFFIHLYSLRFMSRRSSPPVSYSVDITCLPCICTYYHLMQVTPTVLTIAHII